MHSPPSGTVTFLFTDIVGSTQHLQQLGDRYSALLADHHRLLRAAVQAYNGYEVETQGDAFFVAFARATDAVNAAVAGQRALASHTWPDGRSVGVRMGLHTGEPMVTATGYVGLDVHRAARISQVGHGGQVLLSQTTRDLVERDLPAGVSLRDLGEHRLKDLRRPRRLFQLVIEGLANDFPPLKTLDARPNNLPALPTPLIGRQKELAAVRALLLSPHVRLVTLIGPGGVGKTRLSLQVAAELLDHFEDGVFFINLAPISDPALIVSAIAQTFDIREQGSRSFLDGLKDFLRNKRLLLVLDNFEQIVAGAAVVGELLTSAAQLKLLATSREVLRLRGEREFPVPTLALPDPSRLPPLERLTQYASVELFVDRATAVKPDFALTPTNAPAVAEICLRLDGLPLALELAAARIKLLPPATLLSRLSSRLKLLTGGSRDLPTRQQRLHDTIAWSYDLLSEEERALFRRLAIFRGGFTLEAAEAVAQPTGAVALDVLDGVTSLVDKSLAQQFEQPDGEPRFRMLETIREYALERLVDQGEAEGIGQRYLTYFLDLVEAGEPRLVGADQIRWLARLDTEHDNLRAALDWAREHGAVDAGLRLAGALGSFWETRGHLGEGRGRLTALLARPSTSGPSLGRARALNAAGVLAVMQGDYATAQTQHDESLRLYQTLGDERGIAAALSHLGQVAMIRSDYPTAQSLCEQGLAMRRRLGYASDIAASLNTLAHIAWHQGEYALARSLFEEALALYQRLGDNRRIARVAHGLGLVAEQEDDFDGARVWYTQALTLRRALGDHVGITATLNNLGNVASAQGDIPAAAAYYQESLAMVRELGERRGIAITLINLGNLAQDQGDLAAAQPYYRESLLILQELGTRWVIVYALEAVARLLVAERRAEPAARLFGASEALREAINAPLPPTERAAYDSARAALEGQLGQAHFDALWAEGRAMTTEQAIAHALGEG